MKPVKKIEIVIDNNNLESALRVIEAAGVGGYTVLRDVAGKGDRGIRAGNDLGAELKNSYIMVACEQTQVEPILNGIRPLLDDFGGVCLVSDSVWLLH